MNTTTADAGSATITDQPEARQLRRSADDKMLGGVAGGIARYLDADVTLVRVIIAALALLDRRRRSSLHRRLAADPRGRRTTSRSPRRGSPTAGTASAKP